MAQEKSEVSVQRFINKFSLDLFNQLRLSNENTDKMLSSGLSVFTIFSIANLGARNETAAELCKVLYQLQEVGNQALQDIEDGTSLTVFGIHKEVSEVLKRWEGGLDTDDVIVRIANRLLVSNLINVHSHYRGNMKKYYNTDVSLEDFVGSADKIVNECNQWVDDFTNNKIKTILDYVRTDTSLLAINAVYFRGRWVQAFSPFKTSMQRFFNYGTERVQVPMMFQEDVVCECSFFRIGNEGFNVLELPYKGGICFTVILPISKTYLANISSAEFDFDAFEKREYSSDVCDVMLPKMEFQSTWEELIRCLQNLGIQTAFTRNADFTGITEEAGLHISRVLHSATIEVNEEGTEAAAATIWVSDGDSPRRQFLVDHPFIFLIQDKHSGIILFSGQVNKL